MYNVPVSLRSTSPLQMDQERRKKMALESSLLHVNADKRELEMELSRLRQEAQQHGATKQRLRKREEDIGFYEESLQLIRKDMENLNAVIFAKNREYSLVNDELEQIRNQNIELEQEKDRMARTLELVLEEISQLLQHIGEGNYQTELDVVSQFRADCRELKRLFSSMQTDIAELLLINDQIRSQNSQVILLERQKIVRLQYEKKLVEERLSDERRRKQHLYTEQKDSKVHALEVQLLKQQQQSQRRLFQMSQTKTSQSSRITDLSADKQNSLQEQIFTLVRRNKELQKERRDARQELQKLRASYKLVIDKYSRLSFGVQNSSSNDQMVYMKNVRKLEEERKRLEIRIDQLIFKNKALEDELDIYRGRDR